MISYMTDLNAKYADFKGLREQAVALRREGLSLRQIRDRLKIFNNEILSRLARGEPRRSGRSARTRRTTCGRRHGSYDSRGLRTTR